MFLLTDPLTEVKIEPRKDTYNAGEEIMCVANGNPAPELSWKPAGAGNQGEGWRSLIVQDEWIGTKQKLR